MLFLGWLVADQQDYSHASSRRSLLELLDEVSEEPGRTPEDNVSGVAPKPSRARFLVGAIGACNIAHPRTSTL